MAQKKLGTLTEQNKSETGAGQKNNISSSAGKKPAR